MTLINTAIVKSSNESNTEDLKISIQGTDRSISVPARPTSDWLKANTTLGSVVIWGETTDGYIFSSFFNDFFNHFFDSPIKLVYKGPTKRLLQGNSAPEKLGRVGDINFPDFMPLLIANEKSLEELNERLTKKGSGEITIERFRPNIIIRGTTEAWAEDAWKTVRIAPSTFDPLPAGGIIDFLMSSSHGSESLQIDIRSRCARCQVPNVNSATAEKDKHEPWDTLVSYRRIDEGIKYKPCFGMLGVTRREGEIEVGMKFEVTETTDKHNYKTGF